MFSSLLLCWWPFFLSYYFHIFVFFFFASLPSFRIWKYGILCSLWPRIREQQNERSKKIKQNSIMHRAIKLSDSIQCGFNNCSLFWCIHHQNWYESVSRRYCLQHCFNILIFHPPVGPIRCRFNMHRKNVIDWKQMILHWICTLQ